MEEDQVGLIIRDDRVFEEGWRQDESRENLLGNQFVVFGIFFWKKKNISFFIGEGADKLGEGKRA